MCVTEGTGQVFTYLFVCAVGLVTAGLIRNLWQLTTGRQVSLRLLEDQGLLMPLRAMVIVTSAPLLIVGRVVQPVGGPSDALFKWWIALPAALGLSFIQGVVVVVSLGLLR